MFIYTVRPGDSLFSISSAFGIPIEQIRLTNDLTETNIVPGQALLIPMYTYTVQYGDSFYAIAEKALVSPASLQRANLHIAPAALRPGMKITIPSIPKKPITSLGYYGLRSPQADRQLIDDFAPYTTYMAFFEYHFPMTAR